MLRCPPFTYHTPQTMSEAVRLLQQDDVRIVAGGTDLVPNLKRRHQQAKHLVSLHQIPELHTITETDSMVTIGALVTLAEIAAAPQMMRVVSMAARSIASSHIQNTGTLGGNLCLDTRCNYYNQSYQWRQSIDFCMKEQGDTCWVAPGSPRCWAVSSTDMAPALIALNATVTLVSQNNTETINLADMYRDDGMDYLTKQPSQIVTQVQIPKTQGQHSTYWKLRRRGSIDFPVLSIAAAASFDKNKHVTQARLVLGAVASYPILSTATSELIGHPLTPQTIEACINKAITNAKPMDNTDHTLGWRKQMTKHYIRGALNELETLATTVHP